MIYLEPRDTFKRAIILETEDTVEYDFDLIIEAFMSNKNWDYETAIDWYCYNVEPLIHSQGLIVRGDDAI